MKIKDKYQIERKYIKHGAARSGKKISKVLFLVAHETGNNSADAMDHFNYFNNHQPSASAHTFIDDQRILEIVPLDEKAWHVRYNVPGDNAAFGDDANDAAIGSELCRTGDFAAAYDRYVWYHAYLCKRYDLDPLKKIVTHKSLDPSRRNDPESWLNPNGVTWSQFLKDVKKYTDQWDVDPEEKIFSDVPTNHWAAASIQKAKAAGVINGFKDGTFGPDQNLTRAQLAVILDRAGLLNKN